MVAKVGVGTFSCCPGHEGVENKKIADTSNVVNSLLIHEPTWLSPLKNIFEYVKDTIRQTKVSLNFINRTGGQNSATTF